MIDHNLAACRAIESRIRILEDQREAAQRSVDRLTAMIEQDRELLERRGYTSNTTPLVGGITITKQGGAS